MCAESATSSATAGSWLYAWRFNRRHSGKGHSFESRYGSSLIADERHLLAAVRYIAQNPVRAGLTSSPLGWRWSSYAPTIGVRPCPPFLMTAPVLDMFHHEAWRARSAGVIRVSRVPMVKTST